MSANRVLVIEDNPITTRFVRAVLESEGYAVLDAYEGRTAVEVTVQANPDLVLLDLNLPGQDCFELLARLRALPRGGDMPIIAFSALLPRHEQARLTVSGFTDFLAKPVGPAQLVEAVRMHIPLEPPAALEHVGEGRTVLLVDDEQINRRVLALRLAQLGFKVRTAADGAEALSLARAEAPNLIVSDVLMPVMDGLELCEAIRREPALRGTPVILTSATYPEATVKPLAGDVGATCFVERTPESTEILDAVARTLRSSAPPATAPAVAPALPGLPPPHEMIRKIERLSAMNAALGRRAAVASMHVSILSSVSEALAQRPSVEGFLAEILGTILETCGSPLGVVYLVEPGVRLRAVARLGLAEEPGWPAEITQEDTAFLWRVLAARRFQVVPVSDLPDRAHRGPLIRLGLHRVVLIPLFVGEERLGLVEFSLVHDALPDELLGFARTISTQVAQALVLTRTAARLGVSEKRFADLVAGLDAIVWEVEAETLSCTFVNQRAAEILGYPVERWTTDPHFWASTIHPEDRERVLAEARAAVAAGRDYPQEFRVRTTTARTLWLRGSVRVKRDERGRPETLRGVLVDVTAEKWAEARREAEHAMTRILSEAADLATAAPLALRAVCAALGWTVGQLWTVDAAAGVLRLAAFFHPTSPAAEAFSARLRELTFARGAGSPGRIWAEGRPTWIPIVAEKCGGDWLDLARAAGLENGVGFPIREGDEVAGVALFLGRGMEAPDDALLATFAAIGGQLGQFLARKRAEAARAAAEAQLRHAQKMDAVGRLAGGVAHDFNNLLSAIIGFSELASGRLPADETLRSYMAEIQRAGNRAAGLTRQLLAFSRKQVLQPTLVDLNATVRELEKMLRRILGEDIELTARLADDLGLVRVDPSQLEQVLLNLAVNARDAMPRGGKLALETANAELDAAYAERHAGLRPGAYVLVAVSDTGTGMDGETLSHLFEPFFTTKEKGKGTGLGLSTVYGIVQQSGGHVTAYSEPGRGSAFKVYLPRVDAATRSTAAAASAPSHPPAGTERLLLVEDDPGVRFFAREALAACGYSILEAEDGLEALQLAAADAGRIDLLVTDVVMPGMGGRDLAERLARARPGLRVLFISGYTTDAVVRHGVLAGEVRFLQKPFTALALSVQVREVLDAAPR